MTDAAPTLYAAFIGDVMIAGPDLDVDHLLHVVTITGHAQRMADGEVDVREVTINDEGVNLGVRGDEGGVDVTASDQGVSLSVAVDADITASVTTRTLAGTGIKYGVLGRTSRGLLRVKDPSCLTYAGVPQDQLTPDVLSRVVLTEEHDRKKPRGVLAALEHSPDGKSTRVKFHAADGAEGDKALAEADPVKGTRRSLSYDVVGATIIGDTIVAGNVVAFGQCAIPAYEGAWIDTVAAAATTTGRGTIMLSPEQAARLLELQGRIDGGETLSAEEQAEYDALNALNQVYNAGGSDAPDAATASSTSPTPGVTINIGGQSAGVDVAASLPAVPGGAPRPPATTTPKAGGALTAFYQTLTAAMDKRNPSRMADITAALSDITESANSVVDPPAWSGELWSGLLYVPEWSDLFTDGTLTNWEGKGWRFTNKLEIADYAGDKAAIPSDTVGTEASTYEAARMAVGVDIDRKFFDFPSVGFVESLFEQVRESWAIKLDAKIRAYVLANDVAAQVDEAAPGVPVADQPTLLKAAAVVSRSLKRRRVGSATWIMVNDDDLFTLLDIAEKDLPVFLDLYGIDARNFRSDPLVPAGTVLGGVKQAATVRTLPGSPIRVEAQDLAKGGVDEAFFGYWAIEEHHTSAIASATFTPAP